MAKLLQAGWVPAGMAFGIAVAIRHDDWRTQSPGLAAAPATPRSPATPSWSTTSAHDARQRVRRSMAAAHRRRRRRSSAGMRLRIWSIEAGENHRDHVAESHRSLGTAIARFHTAAHRADPRA